MTEMVKFTCQININLYENLSLSKYEKSWRLYWIKRIIYKSEEWEVRKSEKKWKRSRILKFFTRIL